MKNKAIHSTIATLTAALLLMTLPIGCAKKTDAPAAEPAQTTVSDSAAEPTPTTEPADTPAPSEAPETEVLETEAPEPEPPATETPEPEVPATEPALARQNGERFEDVIILEGMEETVRYEHIRNDAIGIEMDYDYESFVRRSEPDRETFVSAYDDPEAPENYLEVTFSPEDAETTTASMTDTLSKHYDPTTASYTLDYAGDCIRIDASEANDGGGTPDQLQMVYVIPADDGCRIATAHYSFESAEGFGIRFSYIVNTLMVIDRQESVLAGTWETASMGYEYFGTAQAEYYVRFTNSEILYGHMNGEEFVLDHADQIASTTEIAAGRYRVQAVSSNGVQYTYQTSESGGDYLEYYETWKEEEFPDKYSGSSSLGRIE